MPVFTALMTSAFEGFDPFEYLVRNDLRESDKAEVRVLPDWVVNNLMGGAVLPGLAEG
jgi:hypothetical protein